MNGLLDNYKTDTDFLHLIKKITNNVEIISETIKQLTEKFPPPENTEYDFSIKEKTLRIIKKKVARS